MQVQQCKSMSLLIVSVLFLFFILQYKDDIYTFRNS